MDNQNPHAMNMPADLEERQRMERIIELNRQAERISENRQDYRYMLSESMAETEDFLRDTSRDRFYNRYSSIRPQSRAGWLDA